MKPLKFIIVLLFLGTAIFAQQSDKTTPPELSKLMQNYVASLNDLFRQYVKDNNFAGAAVVTHEFERVSPCGIWVWPDGSSMTSIDVDGTVSKLSKLANKNSKDVWHWTDLANRKFQINWESGYVDRATLSPDGQTLLVMNNNNVGITVHRLQKIVVPAGSKHGVHAAPTPWLFVNPH